jgi:large subunit ribosomal protein L4
VKVKVLNLDGSAVTGKSRGEVELSDAVFGVEPRADILHRVVTWQLENRRGTARAARERSDVARTGKKFGNQKGGGTARHGDRKAPIFIGGGKAHGPRKRDFDVSLNKKIRALGLKMALSAKAKDGLIIVDSLTLKDAKTKALGLQLAKANWGGKVLVIDGDAVDQGFARAAGNLVGVNVLPAIGANVYDILKHDTLVLTRAAVEKLEARFALPGGTN